MNTTETPALSHWVTIRKDNGSQGWVSPDNSIEEVVKFLQTWSGDRAWNEIYEIHAIYK